MTMPTSMGSKTLLQSLRLIPDPFVMHQSQWANKKQPHPRVNRPRNTFPLLIHPLPSKEYVKKGLRTFYEPGLQSSVWARYVRSPFGQVRPHYGLHNPPRTSRRLHVGGLCV